MQDWCNIGQLINAIHHIKNLIKKNHIIMSIDPENACKKIRYPFLIKTLRKLGIERNLINLIKDIYQKNLKLALHLMVKDLCFSPEIRNKKRYTISFFYSTLYWWV